MDIHETSELNKEIDVLQTAVNNAIELGVRYGQIDGSHHKTWVIDQMIRILAGDEYEEIARQARDGEDGEDTYEWDCGIAP